jgi:hypothetical protein
MSLKDKLEIGLKPDAPYRKDNLPEFQQEEPACEIAATPGDSAAHREVRRECEEAPKRKREDLIDERKGIAKPAPASPPARK